MSQGRVWKRGDIWWIQYNAAGVQYRESAKTSRKENADALLRTRLQEIWEGRFFPTAKRQKPLTLEKLLELWKTERSDKASIKDDEQRLGAFVARFGPNRLLSTITGDDVRAWRAELSDEKRDPKLEPATVNRYLAVVRSAINLAEDNGHQHRNPMAGIKLAKEDNARDRLCSREEYEKLIEAAEGDLRACIVVGYWTGMRLGEIVKLTWDRLDLKAGMLRLKASATKERDAKPVPLPAAAVEELEKLPRRLDGRVFAYQRNWYCREFSELAERLGMVDLTFHCFRHTALTNMADAGVDIVTMAAISGHKTLEMLRRYVHRRPAVLKAAMSKVEKHAQAAGLERS